jgi:hypothetical protein
MMKEIWTRALYLAARQLAGALLPRIIGLINDAQEQFGPKTGTKKKEWVIERLKQERDFFGSTLWSLAPVFVSAVVDVLVAQVKTKGQ